MENFCYLFLLYREMLWELECEEACLRRYNRYQKKIKQKQKIVLKSIKKSEKCQKERYNKRYLSHISGQNHIEKSIVQSMINVTEPQIKQLRILKKILFKLIRIYLFFILHSNIEIYRTKFYHNCVEFRLGKEAAWAAFFAIYLFIYLN